MEMTFGSKPEVWPGRDQEHALFLRWLAQTGAGEPWVLSIHDAVPASDPERRGGYGKSWLLRSWVVLARQRFPHLPIVHVDGLSAADQDGLEITQRVVAHLQAAYAPWQAHAFAERLAMLNARSQWKVDSRHGPVDPELWRALRMALAQDLQALEPLLPAQGPTLLLVYDSCELLTASPQLMGLTPDQPFPERFGLPRVKVLFASRQPFNYYRPLWEGREREVFSLTLSPWSVAQIQQVLLRAGVVSLREEPSPCSLSERLAALTGGDPALVSLACDLLAQGWLRLTELDRLDSAAFGERFAAWLFALEKPQAWWLLVLAHVVPGASEPGVALPWLADLLDLLPADPALGVGASAAALRAALSVLSAVRMSSTGESVTLVEEVRRLVLRYGWERQDPDRRFRRELSRAVLRLCERELQTEQELARPTWQARQVLLLFHHLCVDLEEGWQRGKHLFIEALTHGDQGLACRLLETLCQFKHELPLSRRRQLQRWEDALQPLATEVEEAQRRLSSLTQEVDPV
jgi:hypothetical protein